MELLDRLESADDEEYVELLKELDKVDSDIKTKAVNYAKAMKNLETIAEGMRDEARRLTAAARNRENTIAWMKEQIGEVMRVKGVKCLETEIGKWSTRVNPLAVKIINEDAIPAEYRIPQPDKIDKTAILKAFKEDGECVPGTEVSRGEGVTFK